MKKVSNKKPISPEEIEKNKKEFIYPIILETVNTILAERYSKGRSVIIKLDEITDAFFKAHPEVKREKAFDRHLFDIEDVYRAEGWEVKFDSPSYGDSDFDSYFEFKKKK